MKILRNSVHRYGSFESADSWNPIECIQTRFAVDWLSLANLAMIIVLMLLFLAQHTYI